MENKGISSLRLPILEPKQWITGLYSSRIMNLLEITHFGRGKDVNSYVKQLLERALGGFLCMERHVPIDVDLIAKIIGLLVDRVKPDQYLGDKMKENTIVEEVKSQFGTNRGSIGMIIKNINDRAKIFVTKLMVRKLLRKCHKEEAPIGVVEVAAQCTKGIVLSWAPYFLNLFLEDFQDEQDFGK